MSNPKTPKTDPNQYANALVAKAQAKRLTAGDALTRGYGGVVRNVDNEEFEQILENFNLNSQVVEMAPGQAVYGILVGRGSELGMKQRNPETGLDEDRIIKTWEIDVGNGIKIAIMGAHQLEIECPKHIGKYIAIVRGADVNIKGGKRVSKYFVGPHKVGQAPSESAGDVEDAETVA